MPGQGQGQMFAYAAVTQNSLQLVLFVLNKEAKEGSKNEGKEVGCDGRGDGT